MTESPETFGTADVDARTLGPRMETLGILVVLLLQPTTRTAVGGSGLGGDVHRSDLSQHVVEVLVGSSSNQLDLAAIYCILLVALWHSK